MKRELTDSEIKTIIALARNGLSKGRVAKERYYSWNSIDSQTKKIKQKTGLDPCDYYDMGKLLDKIGGAEDGN